ncbi:N-acetyltransferase [Fibrisoma montanum]|uniref:N-acetyltransferase n=1 Tax=Fibrisoma montanum TaxID=2305895 RepID=A0A418M2L3_9BACT|nr:GNAT family N-acetyltransferase [Fibrisoma montanum]RIV19971.1 N-acetyltransferase [Fibrisoma montanum]
MLELIPIAPTAAENRQFASHPDCEPSLSMTIEFFERVGYVLPWIGYFARLGDELVGSAAFKGKPNEGRVEIAYGVFPHFQNRGIGGEICRALVRLAQHTDPTIIVMARTLPDMNYSARLLQRNGFICLGTVWDEDDGGVWEWQYEGAGK